MIYYIFCTTDKLAYLVRHYVIVISARNECIHRDLS